MPYTLRTALAAFRRTPVLTGLSSLMIALSLFVIGLFALSAYNIRLVLDRIESRVEVVAYLSDYADAEAVEQARAEISAYPEVAEVLYISRAQALEAARQELEEFQAIFADLSVNPLPASFEVRLRPDSRDPAIVQDVAARLTTYPFIEDVRFGRDWLDKIFLLRRIAGAAAFVLGLAFAAVAILIIVTAVRLAIFARRDEIEIMRLVGASRGLVRRPFLLEGLVTGALGGLLACPATYVVYRILSGAVVDLAWLPHSWIASGVAAGALVGTLGSAVAVRKHLRST